MGRRGSAQYVVGEQIEAFRERATRIRQHPLFQNPDYSFGLYVRQHPDWTGLAIARKLLHTNPDHRRWLEALGGPGQAEDEHQAVMRLFGNTGRTARQVDEIIHLAVDSKMLPL